MSYKDGVFAPLEKVEGAKPDAVHTVFSDEERRDIRETVGWLKAAEKSFAFWNNPADCRLRHAIVAAIASQGVEDRALTIEPSSSVNLWTFPLATMAPRCSDVASVSPPWG